MLTAPPNIQSDTKEPTTALTAGGTPVAVKSEPSRIAALGLFLYPELYSSCITYKLDFDGCLLHEEFIEKILEKNYKYSHTKFDRGIAFRSLLMAWNKILLDPIAEEAKQHIQAGNQVALEIGTNRQGAGLDRLIGRIASFPCFQECSSYLQSQISPRKRLTTEQFYFNPYVLADSMNNWPAGTSFGQGLNEEIPDEYRYESQFIDDDKILLIYAQIHQLAVARRLQGNPGHMTINFVDDRAEDEYQSSGILKALHKFFSAHPDALPEGVTLNLWHYKGKGPKTPFETPIKGTGPLDINYAETLKKMAGICGAPRLNQFNSSYYEDKIVKCIQDNQHDITNKYQAAWDKAMQDLPAPLNQPSAARLAYKHKLLQNLNCFPGFEFNELEFRLAQLNKFLSPLEMLEVLADSGLVLDKTKHYLILPYLINAVPLLTTQTESSSWLSGQQAFANLMNLEMLTSICDLYANKPNKALLAPIMAMTADQLFNILQNQNYLLRHYQTNFNRFMLLLNMAATKCSSEQVAQLLLPIIQSQLRQKQFAYVVLGILLVLSLAALASGIAAAFGAPLLFITAAIATQVIGFGALGALLSATATLLFSAFMGSNAFVYTPDLKAKSDLVTSVTPSNVTEASSLLKHQHTLPLATLAGKFSSVLPAGSATNAATVPVVPPEIIISTNSVTPPMT